MEKSPVIRIEKHNSHCLIIILPRIVRTQFGLELHETVWVIRSLGWDKIILCLYVAAITSGYNDGQYNDQV